MIGKTLNHYKIVRKIGSGGMGEIYLAEDLTLNRQVALKVLPPEMAANPNRLGRLEREAKAIAALNHPNIVTIYSIEKSIPSGDGGAGEPQHFITMELISGKTLSRVIPRAGMTLGQILEHGLALTEAMTAAHEKNITHRDLKPDNIMISDDGRLKILDFGLAKLREEADPGAAGTEMPTQAVKTEEGSVLGTVAYMSPEQAEGKPADSRSDIFAIGILLYEMATGERPFQGDTKISLISSILRETPRSITELNRTLPRHLGRIIKRCLAQDPVRRYGIARVLFNDLLDLNEEFDSGDRCPLGVGPGPARQAGKRAVLVTAGIVLLLAATAVIFLLRDRLPGGSTGPPAIEATVTRLTQLPGPETHPSISADGRLLVFIGRSRGNWDIYFQIVGGNKVINLTED
ncbi:MAG: protein kinase, partial [Acidobacteria bacterium]|nr:protein kinase [Acidobacteriota bacterium]